MVILMKNDKSLICSKQSRIYQRENAVDAIVIYVPEIYDGDTEEPIELSDCSAVMYYTNQINDAYTEYLDKQELSDKEHYLMFRLPVTTKFTEAAGNITAYLSFIKKDEVDDVVEVLHTDSIDIKVWAWDDGYKFVPEDSLSSIDKRIAILDAETRRLQVETPNDLTLTEDILQLSHKDDSTGEVTLIGDGIELLTPGDPDDEDEAHDGVIDLDSLKNTDNASISGGSGFQFVEL